MNSRVAVAAGVIVAAVSLAGCAGDADTVYAQAVGLQCSQVSGTLGDLACSVRPPGRGAEHVSRYCYATLGTSNCFDRPDPDRKNQALGSSGY